MKLGSMDLKSFMKSRKTRRTGLMLAFYAVLALLLLSVTNSYLVDSDPHLSAYDDDWDDLSAFRGDLKSMGVDTTSMISSPVLLGELENPEDTVFIVTGVEQDTISLPRFTSDSDLIDFGEAEGYSTTEIRAIVEYVIAGGTILVMDDFGYSAGLAEQFELGYSGHQLYDEEAWARELDYNYVWMNESNPYIYNGIDTSDNHPCLSDQDGDGIIDRLDDSELPINSAYTPTVQEAGLCAHHLENDENGNPTWNFSTNYNVLMNTPSAFDKGSAEDPGAKRYAWGGSSQDSYLDTNDDGRGDVGFEGGGIESDEQGPFTTVVKVCALADCAENPDGPPMGRAIFVTDGSVLMNAIYDWEETNREGYGALNGKEMPMNDNRRWVLDIIAESLLMHTGGDVDNGTSGLGKQVIFDESRHQQTSAMGDTYNLIYYILVYFTNDWMAMLFLFLALFVAFEAVIIKKTDPEPWRHVFSIIYYGFGDARRYGYYGRANKVKQVLLSRVRNLNSLTRDEFDALPARELQKMIGDPVLIKFVFEDRNYSLEQLVAVVKRVKMWGRK